MASLVNGIVYISLSDITDRAAESAKQGQTPHRPMSLQNQAIVAIDRKIVKAFKCFNPGAFEEVK